MEFGVADGFKIVGALAFFIYGMKIMSDGIQKAAGASLRRMLSVMTHNRVLGALTGFLITIIVQSSSATTVMTVSFVNAGLLSLAQSAGIMLGANVGTTITAWIIDAVGKFSLADFSLPLLAVAVPLTFVKRDKLKYIGQFVIGFALLFWGLDELKHAVPDLRSNPEALSFLKSYADGSILNNILFVFVGAFVTIIVQSSSAAMALTITLAASGVLPFEVAAAMILGENIGTTITAELASLAGNVHAKRSARIHSLFNVIGVGWMILLLPVFIKLVDQIVMNQFGGSVFSPEFSGKGIAIFHTTFNVVNLLIMIWFVPFLVRTAIRTVKSKGAEDEKYHLEYISTNVLATPELALLEAKKETAKFGNLTHRMNGFMKDLLTVSNDKEKQELINRIKKYEEITDRIEVEICDYLLKISQGETSDETSVKIRSMLSIANDLERIADLYFQMVKTIERKQEEKIWFSPQERNDLVLMLKKVDEAFDIMETNLRDEYDQVNITKAKSKEKEINALRSEVRNRHMQQLESGEINVKSSLFYKDLYSSIERVGDYIINVSEYITTGVEVDDHLAQLESDSN